MLGGRLVVDNLAPLHGLLDRLDALAGSPPEPSTYRFDQAELALGVPGGRLRDRIAAAAESTAGWRLDDRTGDLLSSALRQRWASVQSPPGADPGALVARLLDRLVELDARVLFVATTGHAVDRTVGLLCDRLARAGRLRSGLVQRVGPLAPGAVRDRWGPYVDEMVIAADLRTRLSTRLSELDRLEGRLRYDEAERRADELDRHAAEVDDLLERTVGARLSRNSRRSRGADPDALVVRQHELRAQRRTARRTAERLALELAGGGRVPQAEEMLGAGDRTPAERMTQLARARDELVAARADIGQALRRHCRAVATTIRSAYLRRLPRDRLRRGGAGRVGDDAGGVLPGRAVHPQRGRHRRRRRCGGSAEPTPPRGRRRRTTPEPAGRRRRPACSGRRGRGARAPPDQCAGLSGVRPLAQLPPVRPRRPRRRSAWPP